MKWKTQSSRLHKRLAAAGAVGLLLSGAATPSAEASNRGAIVGTGDLCLDVPYGDNSNGQDLWIWPCNATAAQTFTYDPQTMELQVLGKCLDIEGTEAAGSDVQLTECGYTGNLNWYGTRDGEIRTERFPGLCLDQRNGATTRRTAVQMWTCNGTAAQRWRFDVAPHSSQGPATSADPSPSTHQGSLASLLDEIAEGEGTGNSEALLRGYASGYDVPLGYGSFTKNLPEHLRKPISTMSIAEVRALQDIIRPRSGLNSSAVGRYQIVGRTLDDLQRKLGFSNSAIFDAEFQDRLAIELLNKRGLNAYLAGRLAAADFQTNLAKEWASVAVDHRDRGYYDGQNSARAGTTNAEIDRVIAGLRS